MKSIQIFLEEFNYIPFGEKPQILFQAWDKFFAIQRAQPEDSNELFQKLLKDLKELAEYKESLAKFSNKIASSSSNQEKKGPSQDSDIRQLIKEEWCVEVFAPILSTKEPEYSSSMWYENPKTTPETESDKIKSGVEELVPILSENKVTSEDKRECDVLVCEDSSAFDGCDNHSDIFSNSKNDDDISSDDDDFEDVEYVEASLPNPEIVSVKEENGVEEENVVQHEEEEEEVDLEDVFQIQ
nr:hypothetical protein [Tanacetum cinerariifolium]